MTDWYNKETIEKKWSAKDTSKINFKEVHKRLKLQKELTTEQTTTSYEEISYDKVPLSKNLVFYKTLVLGTPFTFMVLIWYIKVVFSVEYVDRDFYEFCFSLVWFVGGFGWIMPAHIGTHYKYNLLGAIHPRISYMGGVDGLHQGFFVMTFYVIGLCCVVPVVFMFLGNIGKFEDYIRFFIYWIVPMLGVYSILTTIHVSHILQVERLIKQQKND